MNAEQYRALVDKLESIQQLNELAYGQEDPKNPGFMWVPADGTTPLGDGSKQMIQTQFGEYWNAKKVPIVKPEVTPAPEVAPEVAPEKEPEKEPEILQPQIREPVIEPLPTPTQPCGPEVKEKIKQQKTFNAAYAMARKAGCPDFDWCQIVNVPTPVQPQPAPTAPAGPVSTNPMGDYDPTSFNGQPAAYYEDIEESVYVVGSTELDRVREIAGTQIFSEAGVIPEIKASSKAAAIAIAQKKGVKQFRFCGKYKVQAGKKPQPVQPQPAPAKPQGKVDYLGQQDPLGGDAQNPMSFAANSNFGA